MTTPANKAHHAGPMPPIRITNATTRGTYTGAELAPFAGRCGAMDAYRLPSRVGRQLIEPRLVRKVQP